MQELRLSDLPKAHQLEFDTNGLTAPPAPGRFCVYLGTTQKPPRFPLTAFVVALLLLKVCFAERCSNVAQAYLATGRTAFTVRQSMRRLFVGANDP